MAEIATDNKIVLDAGHSNIKAKTAERETVYQSGFVEITNRDYEKAKNGRDYAPDDYAKVNGIPYVFGEVAKGYGLKADTFQTGAARYTESIYGVYVAVTLARLYRRNVKKVFLFGSHAPDDSDYRQDLMLAAMRDWHIETGSDSYKFNVTAADTFDEPEGGLSNLLYTNEGNILNKPALKKGTTLVIDIGGYTSDFLVVNPGLRIDRNASRSLSGVGIIRVLEHFTALIRSEYKALLKNQNVLNPSKVAEALTTGIFDAGGKGAKDVTDLRDSALRELLNDIMNMYQRYGGFLL